MATSDQSHNGRTRDGRGRYIRTRDTAQRDAEACRLRGQADLVEAARQLRAIVEALPPATARDTATARRIQGAAVALEALAGR